MLDKIKQFMNKAYGNKIFFFLPLTLIIVVILYILILAFSSNLDVSRVTMIDNSFSSNLNLPGSNSETFKENIESKGSVSVDRKVVKEASLYIVVKKVAESVTSVQSIATKYGGFVGSSNISNSDVDIKRGTITLRIPNDKIDLAIDEIKKTAVKVESEEMNSDDVTSQYVDLESRLNSKKSVENQYVLLLQKSTEVEDIVQIHSYLDKVREEIEVLQGQVNYLSNQVSMSSLFVSMTSEAEVQIFGITWHPITTIKQSFRDLLVGLTGVVDFIIYLIFTLPVILINIFIFAVILWAVIKILKAIYRRFKNLSNPKDLRSLKKK